MTGQPRLWKAAVASWQDPKIHLGIDGVLILLNPDPGELENGAKLWCPDCIELALVEGGRWSNPMVIPTETGHPQHVTQACNECEYRGCDEHMDDHCDETVHWPHPIEMEHLGA